MKVIILLLTFSMLGILTGCEDQSMPPSGENTSWKDRGEDYWNSQKAKKNYGDEETVEEARSLFRDPIGWARDLGRPPTSYDESCLPTPPVDIEDGEGFKNGQSLTEEQRTDILNKVGAYPGFSRSVETPLKKIAFGSQEMKDEGYYQYYPSSNARREDRRFGTERTVWRVKAAAQLLKEKGIIMAVGDISKRGGVGTGGHKSHKKGVDVDLRLVAPDGMGTSCAHYSQGCNDSSKTAEMIKAMIAVDPTNVRKVFINDPAVQREVNEYSRSLGLGDVADSCPGHNNHVHVSYKN